MKIKLILASLFAITMSGCSHRRGVSASEYIDQKRIERIERSWKENSYEQLLSGRLRQLRADQIGERYVAD